MMTTTREGKTGNNIIIIIYAGVLSRWGGLVELDGFLLITVPKNCWVGFWNIGTQRTGTEILGYRIIYLVRSRQMVDEEEEDEYEEVKKKKKRIEDPGHLPTSPRS